MMMMMINIDIADGWPSGMLWITMRGREFESGGSGKNNINLQFRK